MTTERPTATPIPAAPAATDCDACAAAAAGSDLRGVAGFQRERAAVGRGVTAVGSVSPDLVLNRVFGIAAGHDHSTAAVAASADRDRPADGQGLDRRGFQGRKAQSTRGRGGGIVQVGQDLVLNVVGGRGHAQRDPHAVASAAPDSDADAAAIGGDPSNGRWPRAKSRHQRWSSPCSRW